MKVLSLQWPVVLVTTIALYALVILNLPLSNVRATIFLFALIAFWSRLPGVGIPHPFWILYNLDLVDVFTIIISINVGPLQAATFAFSINMWSRVCGCYPDWMGLTKDAIFQSFLALFLPFLYGATQSLAFITVFFTLGRSVLYLTVGMLIPHRSFPNQIMTEIQFQSSLIFINLFYVSIFGNYFGKLLQKGISFSWSLFLFATAVIFVFYITFYRNPHKKKKNILKKVVKAAVNKKNENIKKPDSDQDDMKFVKEAFD